MRKMMFAPFVFATGAVLAQTFDPEDQLRYFCRPHRAYFNRVCQMGFNMIENCFWGCKYDGDTNTFDPSCITERTWYMDCFRARGVVYVESMPGGIGLPKTFARRLKDGSLCQNNNPDVALPEARARIRRMAEAYALSVSNHPAFYGVYPSSEVRDGSRPSFTPHMVESYRRATGCEIPAEAEDRLPPRYWHLKDFPASRILPLDYPLLKFYSWWWKRGDGWNDYQGIVAHEFERVLGRGVFSVYDPAIRVPPLWGSGGDVSHLAQWTYIDPDPFNVMYVVSEQNAMARGRPGQGVITMIQGMSYRSRTAPKGVKIDNPPAWLVDRPEADYITVPPDVMREGLWAALARKLDGIGVYAWKSLFDAAPYGFPKEKGGYQFTHPETADVVAEVMTKVARPLGPFLKRLEEPAMEVAVLESYASSFFANRGTFGWGRGAITDCALAAIVAHYQPEVLYEEDLSRGVPPSVKALLLPHCDVVTEPTARAIAAFRTRGGVVFTDEFLAPGVEADVRLPVFTRTCKAAADSAGLARMAAELRDKLLRLNIRPRTDATADLITWRRSAGHADCLFAINDRRGAGDYVGQWGLLNEKGLPNVGTVEIDRPAGAVYDLVRHQTVPFSVDEEGWTSVPVSFKTTDGAAYLVVDRPLASLMLTTAMTQAQLSFTVHSEDKDVWIPISWKLTSGDKLLDSGSGVVRDGVCKKRITLPREPVDLMVFNLADGKVSVVHINQK